MQPGSNTDFMMSVGNIQNTVENPGVVSSIDVVTGCNGLSSERSKPVAMSRLPVKTAVSDGGLELTNGSEAGGMLAAHHLDSSQQSKSLNNTTKSTPVTVDVSSQSADCRSVASVTACANDNAATPLQQFTCSLVDTLPATDQYHGDVENFIGVSDTLAALPAAAHSGDMIQRPSARRLSQVELISRHEDQLTAITQLSKREMRLLIDVKNGAASFDSYVREMKDMLTSKLNVIRSLSQRVDEFR